MPEPYHASETKVNFDICGLGVIVRNYPDKNRMIEYCSAVSRVARYPFFGDLQLMVTCSGKMKYWFAKWIGRDSLRRAEEVRVEAGRMGQRARGLGWKA